MKYASCYRKKIRLDFAAYSPDLPGYVTTGATQEETAKSMEEAITFRIEGLQHRRRISYAKTIKYVCLR